METFSALLAFCAENSLVTGEFPSQRPVARSFDVFLDLRLNKRLSNNRDAGDLRRHHPHYDITSMTKAYSFQNRCKEIMVEKKIVNIVHTINKFSAIIVII